MHSSFEQSEVLSFPVETSLRISAANNADRSRLRQSELKHTDYDGQLAGRTTVRHSSPVSRTALTSFIYGTDLGTSRRCFWHCEHRDQLSDRNLCIWNVPNHRSDLSGHTGRILFPSSIHRHWWAERVLPDIQLPDIPRILRSPKPSVLT